jgi:methionine salvage enolase-phosphatase E1
LPVNFYHRAYTASSMNIGFYKSGSSSARSLFFSFSKTFGLEYFNSFFYITFTGAKSITAIRKTAFPVCS